MTVAIEFEGVRIGGVTRNGAAFSFRTNSDGTGISVQISRHPSSFDTKYLQGTVTDGVATADNNYCATAYVTGLAENTKYYWRAKSVGVGGPVYGVGAMQSGRFRTLSAKARPWRLAQTGCFGGNPLKNSQSGSFAIQNLLRLMTKTGVKDYDGAMSIIWGGDNWYTDGTGGSGDPYAIGSWLPSPLDVFDISRLRTNAITTLYGNLYAGSDRYAPAHLAAAIPGLPMPDDHDWCANDVDGIATYAPGSNQAIRYPLTRQVCHEYWMDTTRDFVNAEVGRDYATQRAEATTPQYYYRLEMPPALLLVLDVRCLRSAKADADTSAKSMLGATQKAWLKSQILNNPQPFLIIFIPVMLDSSHNWKNYDTDYVDDNWKGYSYEREEIMDYIFKHGDPARTIILSSDTHCGVVSAYPGYGRPNRIYELMTAGFWFPSAQDYPVDFTMDQIKRPNERYCPTGIGCSHEYQVDHQPCANIIEFDGQKISAKMVVLYPTDYRDGTVFYPPQTVWQRWYK